MVLLVASTSAFLDGSQNGALDSKPPVKVSVKVQEAPVAQVHEERQVADNKMKRPVHTGVSVVPQHIAGPLPHHALPADIREEPRYATQVHASPPQGAATNADTPQQQAKEEEGVAQLHPSSESLHDAVAWATNHLRDADLEVARAEAEAGNIQLDAKKVEIEAAKARDAKSKEAELGESLGGGNMHLLVQKLNMDAKGTKLITEEKKAAETYKAVAADLSSVTNSNKHPQETGETEWNSDEADNSLIEEISHLKNEIGKQEEAEASTRQMGQSLHALLSDDKFAKRQLSAKTQERNLEQTELDASKLYVTAQEVSNVEQQTGRVDDAREQNSAYFPADRKSVV